MSTRRVRFARSQFVIALLSAAWMTVFLLLDPLVASWVVWTSVPLCALGMLLFRWNAVVGTVLVVAAGLLCTFSGTGYGEIEMLLPTMYLLALLGRHAASSVFGLATLVIMSALSGFRPDAPWFAFPISLLVNGSAWVFGRIVRRRALVAAAAAREAAALASIDLEQVLAEWSLTSRRRAADASLSIVRSAVERMCALAAGAAATGPPYSFVDVDAIRREGERAIGRLHETLTLLDDGLRREGGQRPAGPQGDAAAAAASAVADAVRPVAADHVVLRWLVTAGVLVLSLAVWFLYGEGSVGLLVAAITLPLCAGAVRSIPVVAGLVASAALLFAAWSPTYPPSALLPIGLCLAVLSWDLVRAQRPITRVTMTLLFIASLVLGAQFGHQGIGFVCVLVALAVVAAAEWSLRDDILHAELSRAAGLMSGIAAARVRADRAERAQLARELHDGVSHGITAMTLQAGAALAVGDAARARRSMQLALEVGERTIREIDALEAGRSGDDLGRNLTALVEGARATGLRVEYRTDGHADALSYRIVQEALTNITRYAPGSHVEIAVGAADGRRFVRIADSGASGWRELRAREPGDALQQLGQGRGLRGLAERVAERRGTFRAGADAHRAGFEVYAAWPRDGESPAPAVTEREEIGKA